MKDAERIDYLVSLGAPSCLPAFVVDTAFFPCCYEGHE
jgi:hypothetical protein